MERAGRDTARPGEGGALTPTDLLHVRGDFTPWSVPAAKPGAQAFAGEHGLSAAHLPALAAEEAGARLFTLVAEAVAAREKPPYPWSPIERSFLREAYQPSLDRLSLHLGTSLPLVGLGAPIAHYLPAVARALGTEAIVPDGAAVANAISAIAGRVAVAEEISILPVRDALETAGYTVHSPGGRDFFTRYDEALAFARKRGEELLRSALRARGGVAAAEVEIDVREETVAAGGPAAGPVFLGAVVRCRGAVAEPK